MASISGATSSNMTSSLYNSANVISGLASGLDTEGMIENLVKSYQTKINSLNQQATKTEWKQEAYRSIISKMVGFSNKYTSYSSATNLMSPSFFSNAVKVATQGLYKDKVSASGKTSSDIALNAVHQLAAAAQYRVGDSRMNSGDGKNIQSASDIDLLGTTELGALSGSMTVVYGSQNLNINFSEVADKKAMEEIRDKLTREGKSATDADVLAGLINQKLEGQKITFSNGQSENAEDRVKAVVKNGSIVFEDQKSSAGNALYISQASGNVAKTLGLNLDKAAENKNIKSFSMDGLKDGLTRKESTAEYLSGKALNLTLNGSTKTINLPKIIKEAEKDADGKDKVDADGNTVYKLFIQDGDDKVEVTEDNKAKVNEIYAKQVNEAVNSAFKGKIEVSNTDSTNNTLKLNFLVKEDGSDLRINSDVGEALGIGQTATTYLNTSNTLEKLLGDRLDALETVKDKNGKDVLDGKGNKLYEFKINDVVVGQYTKDTKLSDILSDINSNKDAGVKVSYSQTTKEFLFSAKETGADSEIKMGGGLAQAMFGDSQNTVEGSSTMENILGKDYNFDDAYSFKLNIGGKTHEIGLPFEKDSMKDVTVDEMVSYINGSLSGTGMKAAFDTKSNTISVTDKDGNKVDVSGGDDMTKGLLAAIEEKSIASYTAGKDAKFTATINGRTMEMTRSSNSVDIDGLTINMNAVFDSTKDEDGNTVTDPSQIEKNVVTFKSTTDSDKIVDAVKAMIEDYNAMLGEIRTAYSTLPAQKTDGSSYEPLTSDQASNYSQSEQEKYEEKAKQGLLFADRDLSSLYNKLRGVFSPAGQDGSILRGMGINSSYDVSTGALTITLDEDKLRSMLDSDPDMVADAFTKTSGVGGVMQNLKTTMDAYAKTSGEPKGILIQKAGSPLSPLSLMNNTWQKQIDNYNTQIEKWQDKLSSQVDRYTQQFSRLEQLIQQMNSQSSALAGLMGG